MALKSESHHRVTSDFDAFEIAQRRAGSARIVHFGNRVQQHLGVRVLWVAEQSVLVGQFHQTAADHDTHEVQWAQCINASR